MTDSSSSYNSKSENVLISYSSKISEVTIIYVSLQYFHAFKRKQ